MRGGHMRGRFRLRDERRESERPRERRRAVAEIVGLRSASTETIYPHVFENADREVGGVLVGRMPADGGLPLITAAIPAISADEQRATLTFTQEAWAHVHQVLDTQFPPDEQIVGWYHSHPGFGIFLSGHDLFIHENFFSAPSQIAVVVDPLARREGAFVWRDGKLEALFEQPTPSPWQAPAGIAEMRFERPPLHAPRAELAPATLALAATVCTLIVLWLLLSGSSPSQHPGRHARSGQSRSATESRSSGNRQSAGAGHREAKQ